LPWDTATEAYGYETQIVYMLAKDDEIVADDDVRVSFETERVATDGKTGKPVVDIRRYTYRDGDAHYVVTFERQKTILQAIFTERAPFIKRLIAKIVASMAPITASRAKSRLRNLAVCATSRPSCARTRNGGFAGGSRIAVAGLGFGRLFSCEPQLQKLVAREIE
jgi:hypothetical protein